MWSLEQLSKWWKGRTQHFGAGSGNFSRIPVLPSMGGTGESPPKGHQDDNGPGASLGLLSLEERRLRWEITNRREDAKADGLLSKEKFGFSAILSLLIGSIISITLTRRNHSLQRGRVLCWARVSQPRAVIFRIIMRRVHKWFTSQHSCLCFSANCFQQVD